MLADLFIPYSLNKFAFPLLVLVKGCPKNKLIRNLFKNLFIHLIQQLFVLATGRLSALSVGDADDSQCYVLQHIHPVAVFVATFRTVSCLGLHYSNVLPAFNSL